MKRMYWIPVLLMAFAAILPAADIVVIVNSANKIESLTKAQLRKLLLGEQVKWSGGAKVLVILGVPGSQERAAVLKLICGMSEADFTKHFMQADFVGGDVTAPRVVPSAAVPIVVQSTPGAIGIALAAAQVPNTRVVKIDGLLPGDDAYALSVR